MSGTSLATVTRNDNGQKVVLTYGGLGDGGYMDQVILSLVLNLYSHRVKLVCVGK